MDEQIKEPTKPAPKEPPKPKITWKAVEPRHYLRAQEKEKADGRVAYRDYVVSLVERFEGKEPKDLTKDQVMAILEAFEEKFGESGRK